MGRKGKKRDIVAIGRRVITPVPPLPPPSSALRVSCSLPHPRDVHFCSLARLQGRRNMGWPARKWRNYIRGREKGGCKSKRRGVCPSRCWRLFEAGTGEKPWNERRARTCYLPARASTFPSTFPSRFPSTRGWYRLGPPGISSARNCRDNVSTETSSWSPLSQPLSPPLLPSLQLSGFMKNPVYTRLT